MAFLSAALPFINAAAGAAGAFATVKSVLDSRKTPGRINQLQQNQQLPKAPTDADTQKDATAEIQRRRRASIFSGGRTNITRGKALIPEGAVQKKELLGA